MKQALLEIEAAIKPQELGRLSKARLHQELLSLPGGVKGGKLLLGYVRTVAEMDGLLGGPAELHLHNHQTLPLKVQEMLESKMREIMAAQQAADRGEVVDAEVLIAPAETAPTNPEPPEPIKQEEPTPPLTFEERQNKHLRFHASLMKAERGW